MGRLSIASRSRRTLLIVIAVLLVPTIAIGAKLKATSWTTGSVIVRKVTLPTVSLAIADSDWNAGSHQYLASQPLEIPALDLPDAVVTDLVFRTTVTIPQAMADSFAAVLAEFPGAYCGFDIVWGAPGGSGPRDGLEPFVVVSDNLHVDSVDDLATFAGTYSQAFEYPDPIAFDRNRSLSEISNGRLYTRLGCSSGKPLIWSPPLQLSISVRVVAV